MLDNNKAGDSIINFVENSQFFFGLDNQFEIVRNNNKNYIFYVTYTNKEKNSHTNLNISEINENNKLQNNQVLNNLFEDYIREIRNFYNKYNSENYILVSSRSNEIKVFEFSDKSGLVLKKYIKNIYNQSGNLSSSVIKFDPILNNSEIITSCWLPDKIKKYKFKNREENLNDYTDYADIVNVKYMNIYLNKYLLFCGCNSNDKENCCNCIDLIQHIKYKYQDSNQKQTIFLNLIVYDNNKNQETLLLVCDEGGYIRIFNFYKRDLIQKVKPSKERINTILFINNKIYITEKNTGNFYILDFEPNFKINENKTKRMKVFDDKIFSLRYLSETKSGIFIVANGSDKKELENMKDLEKSYCIKLINLNDLKLQLI